MQRVTGIGGIFFKVRDMARMAAWYRDNLGIDMEEGFTGRSFRWPDGQTPERPGMTVWSLFTQDSAYFDPSTAPFMVNYRVDDLDAMLAQLRGNGAAVDDKVEEGEFGRFGWVMDPEGNRIELWQPPAGM
ncbi:MAG TPA: VOC family protein [Azospirillaceae bacterium]|nr:VOC family protein [Azospirillaceae bacterium]